MKTRTALALLAACMAVAGCAPAPAHADPSTRFANEDGYVPMDADRVQDGINAMLAPTAAASVFLPSADLAPMTLAMLALENSEPALERVRYRLRYGADTVEATPGGATHAVSYIEVARFNLGPAIHREVTEVHGADVVADVSEFGVGPHVAWRLVTQPVMGNRAMVVAAGRMEIDEQAAAEETCLGGPCLATGPGIESMAAWGEMTSAAVESDAGIPGTVGAVATPAQAIALLLGEVDGIESDAAPDAPAIPDWAIEAVVEKNLGQDVGLEAAYRWGGLLDDSVAAIWQRLASIDAGSPEPQVYRASAHECSRGPEFAEPGEYCP